MADQRTDRPDHAVDFVKSDYDQALITGDVHTDNLMTAVLNLAGEVWVLRRRQLIVEQLGQQKVFATAAAIDAYVPSAQQSAAWEAERDAFIERTLAVLTRPGKPLEGTEVPMSRGTPPLRRL